MLPLDQETLFKLVKTMTIKGFYVFASHAEQRMRERNFTRSDVEYILTHPNHLVGVPRYDDTTKLYKYRIADQDNRSVVICIDFDDLMIVITVI